MGMESIGNPAARRVGLSCWRVVPIIVVLAGVAAVRADLLWDNFLTAPAPQPHPNPIDRTAGRQPL